MSIRPDMEKLADKLEPSSRMPHAVPIQHDIFAFYDAIAKREGTVTAVVINDTLRKARGEG